LSEGPPGGDSRIDLTFDDNRLLPLLFGEHEQFLSRIEKKLGVLLVSRGNRLTVAGDAGSVEAARACLDALWTRLKAGMATGPAEVDAAIRMALAVDVGLRGQALASLSDPKAGLRTKRGAIAPRSPTQQTYLEALAANELVFGLGPAGTGKTYLAVAQAVSLLIQGKVERIILSRPAVEAGERLGFLPGDMKEKVDPYLRPLYDALHDMLPGDQVAKRLETGVIEVAPLAFMRGRTLANAFVILDEAQNTTAMQMKMFLTRLGEGSRMAVTGDITQIDLPPGQTSGLKDALSILRGVEGIGVVQFTEADVVRHPLVGRIVHAYDLATKRPAADKQGADRQGTDARP
jgi:phosphate starvation-inducible PhoH-like protein